MTYTERLNKFTWATFENPWDLLLRDCSERREKEKKIGHSINVQKNAYCITNKKLLKNNVNTYVISWNTRNRIGPLVDENKLQFDEKNSKN